MLFGTRTAVVTLAVCLVALQASSLRGADTVRNGGDLVHCAANSDSAAPQGTFVLDYLVGATSHAGATDELSLESVNELTSRLTMAAPVVGRELMQFVFDAESQIGERPDRARAHVWQQRRLGLHDVSDSALVSPLPANCRLPNGDVRMTQVVVRERIPGVRGMVFNYDPDALATIRDDDRQWSFLLVHEWLWSHADNVDVVRNLNWFLHSNELRSLSGDDLIWELASMGFTFAEPGAPQPTVQVRLNGQREPNGRPRFTIPSVAVMPSDAAELRIVNTGAERFRVLRTGDENVELCVLQTECVIRRSDLPVLPVAIMIERDPLADPIWDVKQLIVVP